MMRHVMCIHTMGLALFCAVASALPVLGETDSVEPPQVSIPCEEEMPPSATGESLDRPCEPSLTSGAENEVETLRHEEEKGMRWHALSPQEQDLHLWYYPGAPRPLWGY